MGAAFCAALLLAVGALAALGAAERGTDVALQLTARLSFLLFWLAYTGGALATLYGKKYLFFKRFGREFGLAYASAQLVHLGLVGWLCWIGVAPTRGAFIFFGFAVFWTYLLALASVDRLRRALGSRGWLALRFVGLNCIYAAFAVEFFRKPLLVGGKGLFGYLPFAILIIAGLILRVLAFARRSRTRRAALAAEW